MTKIEIVERIKKLEGLIVSIYDKYNIDLDYAVSFSDMSKSDIARITRADRAIDALQGELI